MALQSKRRDKNIELEKAKKVVTQKPKKQLCLWVDANEYKRLKIKAVQEDTTITDIISKSISLYLNK